MKSLNEYLLEDLATPANTMGMGNVDVDSNLFIPNTPKKDIKKKKRRKKSTISEGGSAGHMMHITDYEEFTLNELKGLIYSIFNNRIEDITEKVDGTNIQVTINNAGDIVFIRNKTDLNSINGGISIDDMYKRWNDNVRVMNIFVGAAKKLSDLLYKINKSFFNPSPDKRRYLNCECVIEGKTNIMPYSSNIVLVHDIWDYELIDGKWVNTEVSKKDIKVIYDLIEETDGVCVTPTVVINHIKDTEKLYKKNMSIFNRIFKKEGLKDKNTIREYKLSVFKRWLTENSSKNLTDENYLDILYDRIILNDTSKTLRMIKGIFPNDIEEITELCKTRRQEISTYVNKEIDKALIILGNDIISSCTGFINDDNKENIIRELQDTLNSVVSNIDEENIYYTNLIKQMDRLSAVNNEINHTEGIVFTYKNRIMKVTGSFAPLNQILGSIRYKL